MNELLKLFYCYCSLLLQSNCIPAKDKIGEGSSVLCGTIDVPTFSKYVEGEFYSGRVSRPQLKNHHNMNDTWDI